MPNFKLESVSSNHLFQALFSNTLQSVVLVQKNLNILAFNEVFANQVLVVRGKALKEGDSFLELTEPETYEKVKADFSRVFSGSEVEGTRQLKGKDGRIFTTRYNYNPLRNEEGEIFAVAAFYQNITAEADAQRKVIESDNLLNRVFEQAHEGIFLFNSQFDEIKTNAEFFRIFGLNENSLKEEIQLMNGRARWNSTFPFTIRHILSLPLREDVSVRILRTDGAEVFAKVFRNEFKGPDDSKIILLSVRDNTETFLALREQSETEERFKTVAKNFPNGNITLIDKDLNVVFSDGADYDTDLGQFNPSKGQRVLELYGPSFQSKIENCIRNAFKGNSEKFEIRFAEKTFSLLITPMPTQSGEIDMVMKIAQNISGEKDARQQVEHQKEYLRHIIDVDPNFIYVKNKEGKILMANKSIARFFGCSEPEFLEHSRDLFKTYRWKYEEVELLESQIFTNLKTVTSEEAIFHKDTRRMHLLQVTRTPFVSAEGESSILYVGVDITDRVNAENELITQREYLRHILDTDPSLIFVKDRKGKYLLVNKAFAEFYKSTVEEMIGKTDIELPWTVEDRAQFEKSDAIVLETSEPITIQETTINPITQRKAHFISTKKPLIDAEGNINILGVVTDITEQISHEEKLKKSEQMLQEIFNRVADALFILEAESLKVVDCNNQALLLFKGSEKERYLQNHLENLVRLKTPKSAFWNDFFYQLKYVNPTDEVELLDAQGGLLWGSLAATRFEQEGKSLILLRISDISVQKESEEQIIQALHEKEILIQEIHHRVKNNMAVISSLLQLQTGYIKDPSLIDVFKDSQSRIKSMALIHEKLYQSKTLAKVEMESYVKELARTLLFTYNSRKANIQIHTEVDNVFLDINSAVPFGLIINEIVSNACKHAFTGRESGNITIRFTKEGEQFRLELKDDGVGMPVNTDFSTFKSLGMNLIHALSSQLGAHLEIKVEGGVQFTLIFAEKIKPNREHVRPIH